MLHVNRLKGYIIAVLLTAVSITGNAASAKPTGKASAQRAVSPPPVAATAAAPAPVRFFTINEVLAAREAERSGRRSASASGAPVRLVSTMPPLPGASAEPFGLGTFRAPEGLLWIKWRGIEQKLHAEASELAKCRADGKACSPAARAFISIGDAARHGQGRGRIELVNRAVNSAVRYMTDFAQHGIADQWSPPLATLTTGRGDCEDYAIAKYAILREAGVAAEDLRLVLVRDTAVRQDHAVLAVRDGGRWLILDNRHLMLLEATMLPQFTPLFALDHKGVSLFAAPYAAQRAPDRQAKAMPAPSTAGDQPQSSHSSAASSPYLL
jgi:predicted transglutaminase-like cysteine proteinase